MHYFKGMGPWSINESYMRDLDCSARVYGIYTISTQYIISLSNITLLNIPKKPKKLCGRILLVVTVFGMYHTMGLKFLSILESIQFPILRIEKN